MVRADSARNFFEDSQHQRLSTMTNHVSAAMSRLAWYAAFLPIA
jgi:hypothetical protein